MSDYIDRGKIREETCKDCTHRIGSDGCGFPEPCEKLLAEFVSYEASDVRPVVRGRWVEKPYLLGTTNVCSVCGENYGMPHRKFKFCPNCGADMREEKP